VHWGAGLSDFQVKDSYQQLRVENVIFKAKVAVGGRKVGVAETENIPMQGITSLKLSYLNGKYNVLLKNPASLNTELNVPLAITRAEGRGSVVGTMSIIDNSFNYTASYLNFPNSQNNFYLATIYDGLVNPFIQTIISPLTEKETAAVSTFDNATSPTSGTGNTSTSTSLKYSIVNSAILNTLSASYQNTSAANVAKMPAPPPRYHLSNGMGNPISFNLLEFNAMAKPDSSYIAQDGKIHLNVELDCYIKNAQPENFKVKIFDNRGKNQGLPELYNSFIDEVINEDSWIIFAHQDLKISPL